MIGGRWDPDDPEHQREPIDYEAAVRDVLRKRRQRKILGTLARIADPRPTSPGQVVVVGLVVLIVGWIVPAVHVAMVVGTVLLIFGFASGLIQPRGKRAVWRNRDVEIPPEKRWTDRIYYLFYRRSPC